MTQMATGRRGHPLRVSKPGAAKAAQQNEALDNAYIAGPAAAAPFSFAAAGAAAAPVAAGLAGTDAPAGEDYVSAVWRTSSYLETVQWELDVAHESLVQAIREAAANGVDQAVLLQAANMTPNELAAAMVDTTPAFPAAI
ncbi:hypothetical protein ACIQF8_07825 [Pseudarthrobacter sp. NPDC092184]|uniref:hypothetical protein n=1 Tax=unclassified Pseudarthrobacter TaxID=2647000 RepID=UPI0032F057D1